MSHTLEIDAQIEGDLDLSFISEMVEGGMSDDGSPLIGDISFNDHSKLDSNISDDDVNKYLAELGIE